MAEVLQWQINLLGCHTTVFDRTVLEERVAVIQTHSRIESAHQIEQQPIEREAPTRQNIPAQIGIGSQFRSNQPVIEYGRRQLFDERTSATDVIVEQNNHVGVGR